MGKTGFAFTCQLIGMLGRPNATQNVAMDGSDMKAQAKPNPECDFLCFEKYSAYGTMLDALVSAFHIC